METEHNTGPAEAAKFRRALVFANPKAKLFDQMTEVCRLLHYSRRTERTYAVWIRRFLVFHRSAARPPFIVRRHFSAVRHRVGRVR